MVAHALGVSLSQKEDSGDAQALKDNNGALGDSGGTGDSLRRSLAGCHLDIVIARAGDDAPSLHFRGGEEEHDDESMDGEDGEETGGEEEEASEDGEEGGEEEAVNGDGGREERRCDNGIVEELDAQEHLNRLLYPVEAEEFLETYYKRKCLAIKGAGIGRVEQLIQVRYHQWRYACAASLQE